MPHRPNVRVAAHFLRCLLACVVVSIMAGCDQSALSNSEMAAQKKEEQRLQEQKERADLADRLKAQAIEREKKQEPIRQLEIKIAALDQQITEAQQHGRDWRPLEKQQEALQAQKEELERQ